MCALAGPLQKTALVVTPVAEIARVNLAELATCFAPLLEYGFPNFLEFWGPISLFVYLVGLRHLQLF